MKSGFLDMNCMTLREQWPLLVTQGAQLIEETSPGVELDHP